MRYLRALALAFLVVTGCVTTPLPVPPTIQPEVHPELITIVEEGAGALITGADGAIQPGGSEVRLTYRDDSTDSVPLARVTLTVGETGAFEAQVIGRPTDVYYIEFLLEEEDLFVMAITSSGDASGSATEADPGPDSDTDGSPDQIDCAPLDETLGGQRCP